MLDGAQPAAVSMAERQKLITAVACFSMLSAEQSEELVTLMQEVHFAAGEVIVTEDALVDSVYIIANGQAEVTRAMTFEKRIITALVASISSGDSIGLNNTGFFSTTGKRTATVVASTDMVVLKLNLKALHQFLQKYPHLSSAMISHAEQMLRVQLIRQSLPFTHLSYERMQWLASQVEEVRVKEGDVLFKQGDQGDRCYLIKSGKIEIVADDSNDTEHRLALLKPPMLFGEATFITREPRNATARATEDSELLELEHRYLSELFESEKNVANMFMTLMLDRSRPLQNPHVSANHLVTADNQAIIILKNPESGNYFKLSPEGWYIWRQLNGKNTMKEVTMLMANEFNIFAPDVVTALISKLAKAGFVSNVEVVTEQYVESQPLWVRATLKIRRILEARVAIGDADKFLSTLYNKFGYLLFSHLGKVILTTLVLTGFATFIFTTNETIDTFRIMPDVWMLLVCLIPATILSVALHELGHALAVKSFGHEVHYMGVGWYWLGPVAFVDTSDMWLSTRGPRTVVNLAGVFTDTLTAGICSLLILVVANPYIQSFLWLFALFTYVNAFRMLNPLQELDGYYILMDWVEMPHLRQAAVLWLTKKFPKVLKQPRLVRENKAEAIYWLACIVFIILVSILTLLVQTFVFKILGIHSNPYTSLILPVLVAVISCLGIIADIRNQTEE